MERRTAPHQPPDAAELLLARREHERFALIQSEIFPDCVQKDGNEGHETQPARLNETDDDHLSEDRPMGIGIVGDEAGDAGSGCGCEQRIDVSGGVAVPARRGEGKHEQQAPRQDDDEKSQREKLPYGQFWFGFQFHDVFRRSANQGADSRRSLRKIIEGIVTYSPRFVKRFCAGSERFLPPGVRKRPLNFGEGIDKERFGCYNRHDPGFYAPLNAGGIETAEGEGAFSERRNIYDKIYRTISM